MYCILAAPIQGPSPHCFGSWPYTRCKTAPQSRPSTSDHTIVITAHLHGRDVEVVQTGLHHICVQAPILWPDVAREVISVHQGILLCPSEGHCPARAEWEPQLCISSSSYLKRAPAVWACAAAKPEPPGGPAQSPHVLLSSQARTLHSHSVSSRASGGPQAIGHSLHCQPAMSDTEGMPMW